MVDYLNTIKSGIESTSSLSSWIENVYIYSSDEEAEDNIYEKRVSDYAIVLAKGPNEKVNEAPKGWIKQYQTVYAYLLINNKSLSGDDQKNLELINYLDHNKFDSAWSDLKIIGTEASVTVDGTSIKNKRYFKTELEILHFALKSEICAT